jgi:AcrR family transcriptional regulator
MDGRELHERMGERRPTTTAAAAVPAGGRGTSHPGSDAAHPGSDAAHPGPGAAARGAGAAAPGAGDAAEERDGRRRRGRRTRASILATAADVASVEGLEGLTIGRLAARLGMSKSGLFAHFGSKEELQLATIEAAGARFADRVVRPSRTMPPGRARLDAVVGAWLDYFRADEFPGGCFFATAWTEFASRPAGPVRDALCDAHARWRAFLRDEVAGAQRAGELDPAADPDQVAFELDALCTAANDEFQLHRDPAAFERARAAVAARLQALGPR